MLTAVQLRDDRDLKCEIIYGTPIKYSTGRFGPIAHFPASVLVVYMISKGRKKRAYLFRAANSRDKIPGVYPAVKILIEARTNGKVKRLKQILNAITIDSLPDGFFIRVNALIDNRYFKLVDVRELLIHTAIK